MNKRDRAIAGRVAKEIFRGFCLDSKNMKEKERLVKIIDLVVPDIRIVKDTTLEDFKEPNHER